MEFKIHSDSEPNSPNPRSRPPNYSTTSVRIRLASLVAALGLVFVAMNEAGKPETWERLGFRSTDDQIDQSPDNQSQKSTAVDTNSQPIQNEMDTQNFDSELKKFWFQFFNGLTINQKKSLVNKFWQPATVSADAKLIADISKKFFKAYLDRNPNLSESQIDSLFNSIDLWQQFLASNELPDSEEFLRIRKIYEDSIYEVVEDRSAMNRSIESAAWNWSWKKLVDQKANFPAVTYIQLAGQPGTYRGERIRITGSARGVQKIDLPEGHELGIESYKVLWIKPEDSNRVPYCVYTNQLPIDFPEPTGGFVEMNEHVSVDGIFFKLRSYAAQNDQIEICPLIVADSINWTPNAAAESVQSWQPPAWLLTLFFVGMPVVAGLLAWSVYRATAAESPASRIGVPDNHDNTWNDLSSRSDIKSDAERINELYPSE